MTSPGARQRRRRQQYQSPRTRAEVVTAVAVAVAIVVGTALMIWLLRPGGIADRQPRSSWLVGIVLIASAVLCYEVLRPKSPVKLSRRVALGGGFGVIAVATVLAGVFWPGGLVRHPPSLATPPTVPTSSTVAPGSTVATTAPGATTAPSTTAPGSTQTTAASQSTTSSSPPTSSP